MADLRAGNFDARGLSTAERRIFVLLSFGIMSQVKLSQRLGVSRATIQNDIAYTRRVAAGIFNPEIMLGSLLLDAGRLSALAEALAMPDVAWQIVSECVSLLHDFGLIPRDGYCMKCLGVDPHTLAEGHDAARERLAAIFDGMRKRDCGGMGRAASSVATKLPQRRTVSVRQRTPS